MLPPKTQPVSMLTVPLSHSGSGTGVWPYTTIACPRYSAAQLKRTGRPNSSVSPVVSPYRAKSRTLGRPPALHPGLHAGMGDDELAIVEEIMAYEPIEELGQFLGEGLPNLNRQGVDLHQ